MWKRKAVIWIHTLFQCDIFEDIAEDVKTSFDTSSYELNIPFKRQFKDELDGKAWQNLFDWEQIFVVTQ